MLSNIQSSIVRSLRKGHSVAWVDVRQAGKTYLGHYVAGFYKSVAYINASWAMAEYKRRQYREQNGHVTYFNGDNRHVFCGDILKGYQLIVVDDFEIVPEYMWSYIYEEVKKEVQVLAMATVWQNFMIPTKQNSRSNDLNDIYAMLYNFKFDMYTP